ncbi:hypothetical protein cyc_07738 [Cyclospora cayetanensis]|uniref:Uncharacterized protein n=1 Tax=Cyclospora cayetanensis TaxID=88456 RepID=A0A1D3CS58_9EIME|nr:hypothetical protein cyc_07738 [Cyclospora cayetanensis]
MQRGADCLRMALHAKSLAARLQLQQTGSWEGAAFAARGVPVTEKGVYDILRRQEGVVSLALMLLLRDALRAIRSLCSFEKEILPAILRTYYAESFPLLALVLPCPLSLSRAVQSPPHSPCAAVCFFRGFCVFFWTELLFDLGNGERLPVLEDMVTAANAIQSLCRKSGIMKGLGALHANVLQRLLLDAKHAALQRRVGADHHLSKQLDLPQLARLLKILKFLCVLLKKQRRTFANQKDLEKQLRVGEEGPGAAVTAWLQSEYLLKNENDKYSMPKAYQTKVLATILWSCCALSADFKFDFSSLLETEFNNEKTANFAACASLIGMKPSRGNKNEYQLCFPSPLASLEEASDLSKAVQSVLQEKKRR